MKITDIVIGNFEYDTAILSNGVQYVIKKNNEFKIGDEVEVSAKGIKKISKPTKTVVEKQTIKNKKSSEVLGE